MKRWTRKRMEKVFGEAADHVVEIMLKDNCALFSVVFLREKGVCSLDVTEPRKRGLDNLRAALMKELRQFHVPIGGVRIAYVGDYVRVVSGLFATVKNGDVVIKERASVAIRAAMESWCEIVGDGLGEIRVQ